MALRAPKLAVSRVARLLLIWRLQAVDAQAPRTCLQNTDKATYPDVDCAQTAQVLIWNASLVHGIDQGC
jgi:hypothetical protein